MRQRKRKENVIDYTGHETDFFKVIKEIKPGKWLVDCKECDDTHIVLSRNIKRNWKSRDCNNFKPYNWSGLDKWDAIIRRQYGISLEEYYKLIDYQNGGCAICGREQEPDGRKLSIDHDHSTGKVRGVLCYACNKALGMFYDKPERLEKAAEYLRKTPYSLFKKDYK